MSKEEKVLAKAAKKAEREVAKAARLAEKEAKKAEKEAAKAAKQAEKDAAKGLEVDEGAKIEVEDKPKFDPKAKVDVVNPRDLANYYARTYSEERHGEGYLELAEEFAKSKGYAVTDHDKARVPGYKPKTAAQDEVLGNEK